MTTHSFSAQTLSRELARHVPNGRVHTDELTLAVYSRCADFYEFRPLAVVKARTEEEVVGVLRVANAHRLPVTFRAAGTSLSGQVLGTGIICDISTGFQKIEPRDHGNLVCFRTGAGAGDRRPGVGAVGSAHRA